MKRELSGAYMMGVDAWGSAVRDVTQGNGRKKYAYIFLYVLLTAHGLANCHREPISDSCLTPLRCAARPAAARLGVERQARWRTGSAVINIIDASGRQEYYWITELTPLQWLSFRGDVK